MIVLRSVVMLGVVLLLDPKTQSDIPSSGDYAIAVSSGSIVFVIRLARMNL